MLCDRRPYHEQAAFPDSCPGCGTRMAWTEEHEVYHCPLCGLEFLEDGTDVSDDAVDPAIEKE